MKWVAVLLSAVVASVAVAQVSPEEAARRMRERELARAGVSATQPADAAATILRLNRELAAAKVELEKSRAEVQRLGAQVSSQEERAKAAEKAAADAKDAVEQVAKLRAVVASYSKEHNKGDRLSALPITGEETSPTQLKANASSMMGQPVIVFGALRVTDRYLFGYSDAGDRFYSLQLGFLTPKAEPLPAESIVVYADKRRFKPLVDQLAKAQDEGRSRAVRLMVRITPVDFTNGEYNRSAQLLGWQVLDTDRSGWGDWQRGGE